MSTANTMGSMFANATGGGLDALLATNGAFGTATGAGAGLMSRLASALPYAGIALALASFLEGDRGGPKTEGGADLASTIQQQYNGIAAQLGITNKAIFEAFYSKDPQGDSLTQLRVATLSGGRNIYERLGEENVGRSDAEFAAAVGDATMRAIIAALKDSDLSNEYKQYLNALADDASTADMQRAIDLIGQRKALDEEWLTLTSTDAENLARARKRELDAAGAKIAGETGLTYRPAASGEKVAGVVRQRLALASGRFAMIDDGLGFQLVPWSPSIERQIGQHVSGVSRGAGGVDWSFGRNRGLGM